MIYLVHFSYPVHGKNQHYLGYTEGKVFQVIDDVRKHREGLTDVELFHSAKQRNIAVKCVRIWDGDERVLELLKGRHREKLCPSCNGREWERHGKKWKSERVSY